MRFFLLGFTCAALALPALAATPAPTVDFGRDVRPILSNKCFKCHGPDEATRQAGLRLDTFDGAIAPSKAGLRAIVPGDSASSELLARIASHNPDDRMPPPDVGNALTAEEQATLATWITEGAVYQQHWSFTRVERPVLPLVQDRAWPRNPIDDFILARLEAEGLQPSPEASRATLARRVYLDLTGLPPTPEAIAAFEADQSAVAYEAMVDRLLASPHFGERWARVWLDLARYADTKGYEKDDRRTIWRFRDWVIDAFNADMPYDQFTIEQLAGDLLPNPTLEQQLATAFHRNTMTNDEGGTDDEEFRSAAIIDRVNTTASVWMGLTMACAQCHTHKYDPITHTEYYQFYDFFNQTEDADTYPVELPILAAPTAEQQRQRATFAAAEKDLQERLAVESERLIADGAAWEPALQEYAAAVPAPGVWHATAPYPAENFDIAFDTIFPAEQGKKRNAASLEKDATWTEHPEWQDGAVHALPNNGAGATYLYRVIETPRAGKVTLYLGSNDGLQVWLNGNSLHTNRVQRAAAADQDTVVADLRKGKNTLLMKIADAGGAHGFYFRMAAEALPADVLATLQLPADQRTPEAVQSAQAYYASVAPELAPLRTRLAAVEAEAAELEKVIPQVPVLRELPADKVRKTRIFDRGSFLMPAAEVTAGVPAALPGLPADTPRNRLGLARWLVSREHPLTARVAVNRFWESIFGTGIVATLEDFGTQGEFPSHPELLNWLAADFMEQGWSVKQLCRTIVTSATYRQSSTITPDRQEKDPYNRLLARGPRFRLEAETIRDQALTVAGLYNPALHGPSVMPPQPEGVWQLVYSSDKWVASEGDDRYRRGLYTFWRRSAPYPSMMTFDATSREVCTAQRTRTNTPLQAFVTLNDPVYVEAAQALARRMITEGGETPVERAKFGFLAATGRAPQPSELVQLTGLYQSERNHYDTQPDAARDMATNPMGPLPESIQPAEAAAWTVVGNVLLNLDEVLNKT